MEISQNHRNVGRLESDKLAVREVASGLAGRVAYMGPRSDIQKPELLI